LNAGNVLVAYTVGVSEAINDAGEEFGETRLIDAVEAVRHQGAAQICSTILDTIRAHRGGRQDQDDVTVMVVKAS
jgi:sigma-B regulation protein RsbU (phosphoserine phosphatase)